MPQLYKSKNASHFPKSPPFLTFEISAFPFGYSWQKHTVFYTDARWILHAPYLRCPNFRLVSQAKKPEFVY